MIVVSARDVHDRAQRQRQPKDTATPAPRFGPGTQNGAWNPGVRPEDYIK